MTHAGRESETEIGFEKEAFDRRAVFDEAV